MVRKSLLLPLGLALCAALPLTLKAQETSQPAASNSTSTDVQWVWGEVASVDPAAGTLAVKYLDYDTDEEKAMNMTVADTTTFQEVKGLDGIKPQDTVSVEYIVKEGKNLARDITVEKVEDAADTGTDQTQQLPPEKVGSGPVSETDGPAQPSEQPQGK